MKDSNLLKYSLRWHGRAAVEPVYGTGVVVEELVERGCLNSVASALWFPGGGYEVVVSLESIDEPRKLSETAKQSIRRKSLRRRVVANAPLFADELERAALKSNPDYFGVSK
jgi:hypothetical protein